MVGFRTIKPWIQDVNKAPSKLMASQYYGSVHAALDDYTDPQITSVISDGYVIQHCEHLYLFNDPIYPTNNGIFQQDTEPYNEAQVALNWFEEYSVYV